MKLRELITAELDVLPEELLPKVYAFLRFLNSTSESFDGLLLSESSLRQDWGGPEEDAAWASL